MPTIFYCTRLNFPKCNGFMSCMLKAKYELYPLFFEDISACKISWYHGYWCISCLHLRSLNVRRFGIVEDSGLKCMVSR
jgi:hypothetical protein